MDKGGYFDSSSFSKSRDGEINGFIENVDRDLRRFFHANRRSTTTAYILAVFLGLLGIHHFYLGRRLYGMMHLCTFGLFGVGYVVDLFRIPTLVKEANIRRIDEEEERTLGDLYVLWFPCGILGFHHFYLRNPVLGVLYLLTGGIWGMGWLVDGIQLSGILQQYNNKEISTFSLVYAYLFMLPPFGILGFHHYYCRRQWWGVLYSLTLGCFLLGWIVDFLRIPFLVSRSDSEIDDEDLKTKYYMDDAYVLWLSFGLLGFHQFYLKRYRWGVVYALTLGLFGIGWIIDAFKIPRLVRQLNIDREEEEDISNVVSNFHKRKESMTMGTRRNESYSRFDDVMQKHHSDSPRIFTVQRNMNDKKIDEVLSDDDHDNSDYQMFTRQIRRTLSSHSNATHTVPVEVHQVPNAHPVSHHGETDERVKPKPRTVQKRKTGPTNKARQHTEKPILRAENANKDEGESYKDHELLNKSGVITTTDVMSLPNHNEGEIMKIQSQNGADLTRSRSQNVNRVTIDTKRRRHRQKRESFINGGGQEQDLADSACVLKPKRVSGDVLNNDLQRPHQSQSEYQTTENTTIEYSKTEAVENSCADQIHLSSSMKSKHSVGRSVSITSQKSITEPNVIENSMTSIDVNRMSIPILGDTFDDDTVDTPRSTGGMTPRSDSEAYNSLPRVIKVKKSKSMEQMKRNLRRSIKRSRHRIEGVPVEKISEESRDSEDCYTGNAIIKSGVDPQGADH